MKNKITIWLVIVIVLDGLLFGNVLLLGFTHRLMAFYLQWIILLLLILTSIDLIFFRLYKLFAVLMFIFITLSIILYFNIKQDLRFEAQMLFFNYRKAKVNQLADFVNSEYAAGREINKDSLISVVKKMGFEGIQIRKDYVALKVGSGYNGINGFIYTNNPKPRVLFGEYVKPREEIDKNWYNFNY